MSPADSDDARVRAGDDAEAGSAFVAPQITDAVTQDNVSVLASGPGMAALQSAMSLAQGQGTLFANMVANQQQMTVTGHAATSEAVALILGLAPKSQD